MREVQRAVWEGVQCVPGYAATTPDFTCTGVFGSVLITGTDFPVESSICIHSVTSYYYSFIVTIIGL